MCQPSGRQYSFKLSPSNNDFDDSFLQTMKCSEVGTELKGIKIKYALI